MRNPKRPPTIIDLAAAAGVSKTTVSDALRDDGRVTFKTRRRIKALARKLGYIPNTFAAALASSRGVSLARSVQVAFVTHLPVEGYNNHSFLPMQQRLSQLGYHTDWFDLAHEKLTAASLRHTLFHRGYRGIVFSEIRMDRTQLFDEDWSSFSVVCATRTHYEPPFDLVRTSPFKSINVAWSEIRRAGYTRIGFMLFRHQPEMLDDLEREGALAALQQRLAKDETAVPPYFGRLDDQPAIAAWYYRNRPDAVVGFLDFHVAYLREMGLRVPEDVGFVSLHGEDSHPEIASVRSGIDQISIVCADHMDQLIRHNRFGAPERPREILAPVTWREGLSLPRKKLG